MNTLYPIFLKMERAPVLVVGGGTVAEQKVRGLLAVQADITVIAPHVTSWLEKIASDGQIRLLQRTYGSGDVKGFALVFASTNNPEVHKEIFSDATKQNIPVNVVDVPDLCNFYLASVFQNGDLKVAISTNGKSPTLGKVIRDRIAAEFGNGYPELLEDLGDLRSSVHSIYPAADKRKSVFEQIVSDELKRRNLPIAGQADKAENDTSDQKGKVYLIGAGPGDPELITVKGLRLIEQADVVAYDALISFDLLSSTKPGCEKIFVGKRSDGHFADQREINSLLVKKAKEGKAVVRLKGGDPFVFGRGGEEVEALHNEGIKVEIVPGITAGTGVPSSLGIPLTHRGISSNVVFVTGSETSGKSDAIDWKKIAGIDTIVIYMGIKNLRNIVTKLITAGRSPDTPVVVIFGGTTLKEIVVDGTLSDISDNVDQIDTDKPGIILVGNVTELLQRKSGRHAGSETSFMEKEFTLR
jgi:uroporphyrin-III C-methyltransferase / precorrin-2 dehydrogenase / sirohydrochlorin ferrochelatase